MQGRLYYPNMIGGIPVDVIVSNNHILSADVSQNTLETGTKISEHVVLQPRTLSIMFQQNNTDGGAERARSVWGQFKRLWFNRELVSIITEHQIYENMVITNLTALEAAPYKGALQCSLVLTQINFVNLQYIQVPENHLSDDKLGTQKTASSAINGGSQSGYELTENSFKPIPFYTGKSLIFVNTPLPPLTMKDLVASPQELGLP